MANAQPEARPELQDQPKPESVEGSSSDGRNLTGESHLQSFTGEQTFSPDSTAEGTDPAGPSCGGPRCAECGFCGDSMTFKGNIFEMDETVPDAMQAYIRSSGFAMKVRTWDHEKFGDEAAQFNFTRGNKRFEGSINNTGNLELTVTDLTAETGLAEVRQLLARETAPEVRPALQIPDPAAAEPVGRESAIRSVPAVVEPRRVEPVRREDVSVPPASRTTETEPPGHAAVIPAAEQLRELVHHETPVSRQESFAAADPLIPDIRPDVLPVWGMTRKAAEQPAREVRGESGIDHAENSGVPAQPDRPEPSRAPAVDVNAASPRSELPPVTETPGYVSESIPDTVPDKPEDVAAHWQLYRVEPSVQTASSTATTEIIPPAPVPEHTTSRAEEPDAITGLEQHMILNHVTLEDTPGASIFSTDETDPPPQAVPLAPGVAEQSAPRPAQTSGREQPPGVRVVKADLPEKSDQEVDGPPVEAVGEIRTPLSVVVETHLKARESLWAFVSTVTAALEQAVPVSGDIPEEPAAAALPLTAVSGVPERTSTEPRIFPPGADDTIPDARKPERADQQISIPLSTAFAGVVEQYLIKAGFSESAVSSPEHAVFVRNSGGDVPVQLILRKQPEGILLTGDYAVLLAMLKELRETMRQRTLIWSADEERAPEENKALLHWGADPVTSTYLGWLVYVYCTYYVQAVSSYLCSAGTCGCVTSSADAGVSRFSVGNT